MNLKDWAKNKESAYKKIKSLRFQQLAEMTSEESFQEFIEIWDFAQKTSPNLVDISSIVESIKIHAALTKKFNSLK